MFGKLNRFTIFAWSVVGYNILVILWGAWVRITGSGAGCGEHWPDCNGEVLPRAETTETLIEFTHRLTSGLSLIFTVILVIWAFKKYEKGDKVRKASVLALAFLIAEALLGAGLVIFGLVANNDSEFRAVVVALHLVNTCMLVAFGVLTAYFAGGGEMPKPSQHRKMAWLLLIAIIAMLITNMSGAITALGDTLFPVDTSSDVPIMERLKDDLSPTVHFLVRLRIIHPIVAVVTAVFLMMLAAGVRLSDVSEHAAQWSSLLAMSVIAQVGLGFLNIALAAPGWLQLVHLAVAQVVWISLIVMGASMLSAASAKQDSVVPIEQGA